MINIWIQLYDKNKFNSIDNFYELLFIERKFCLIQCSKILVNIGYNNFSDIFQSDFCIKLSKINKMVSCTHKFTCNEKLCSIDDKYPLLEETTNTLAYYILRSLLFYNIFDFIKLFMQDNKFY